MNLYEITEEAYAEMQALLEKLEGQTVSHETYNELMESHLVTAKEKQLAVAAYIKNLESDLAAMNQYIDAMKDRVKRTINHHNWLKDILAFSMKRLNVHKVENHELTVAFSKNPPRVVIDDEQAIPCDYQKVKTEQVVDKKKLRADLLDGLVIPGAHLEQQESLRIKT